MANVLRENGVLGTIKAQLRSNVYLALDDGKELRVSQSGLWNLLGMIIACILLCTLEHHRYCSQAYRGFVRPHWVIWVQAIIDRIRRIVADEIADVLDIICRFRGVGLGLGVT